MAMTASTSGRARPCRRPGRRVRRPTAGSPGSAGSRSGSIGMTASSSTKPPYSAPVRLQRDTPSVGWVHHDFADRARLGGAWRARSRPAQPRPTRRRRPPRRAAAGGRRRRLRQDPGAHPSHRPSHRRGHAAVGDPGDHVHQQGGRGDASSSRRTSSGRSRGRCGCARSTLRACASCGPTATARLSAHVQHLRPGRFAAAHRLRGPRPQPRRQALPAARRARPDQPVEERAGHARSRPSSGRPTSSSASTPTSTSSTRRACSRPGRWTSTTC